MVDSPLDIQASLVGYLARLNRSQEFIAPRQIRANVPYRVDVFQVSLQNRLQLTTDSGGRIPLLVG
jgi:hypothetical protein